MAHPKIFENLSSKLTKLGVESNGYEVMVFKMTLRYAWSVLRYSILFFSFLSMFVIFKKGKEQLRPADRETIDFKVQTQGVAP